MKNKIKVGIFLGGRSREREISFAGGRTVYDNLDKGLFEPITIFVDSFNNFIHLDWRYLYQGSIRDFYPPSDVLTTSKFQIYIESLGDLPGGLASDLPGRLTGDLPSGLTQEQLDHYISKVGKQIKPDQFRQLIDFAFLALHGPCGEDGTIQGLLEWYQIPYSGSGVLGAALGIDKMVQKKWMQASGYLVTPYEIITRRVWQSTENKWVLFENLVAKLGLPLVVKSPRQGSSIGVSIVHQKDLEAFIKAMQGSFFIEQITAQAWRNFSPKAKEQWLTSLIDLRSGIGLPVRVNGDTIYHPNMLLAYLNNYFAVHEDTLELMSLEGETSIIVESFITGREFSCIVLQEAGGEPIALSPTEMLKGDLHFDYRAKYLPGLVRKETPMQLPELQLDAIKKACVQLFQALNFEVYARIDGILGIDHQIYLNDPNTTAGMNPSSFLFHQAAEIGLNPTQLLTFIIRNSLAARVDSHKTNLQAADLLGYIDEYIAIKVGSNQ